MSVVYTGGTFDMFHIGHVQLLRACRRIAGESGQVIVALNTDEFIEKFKGAKPILSYADREAVLRSNRYVDTVVPNIGGENSTLTIEKYGPVDFVAIGSDWAPPKDYYGQMGFTVQWLNDNDITLVYVDRNTGMSTTEIKQRMKKIEH